jgi:hypothetical protein
VEESVRRRVLLVVLVLGCVAGGAASLLLAADVAATRAALSDDDVRYRTAPEQKLWSADELVPGGVARSLLGVHDDLLFRRALRAVRLSHPEMPGFSDPAFVLHRNDASAWLVDVVQGDESLERRSAAANLLGILSFADAIADYQNRAKLLEAAGGRFRQAVSLDSTNEVAKVNLELTLSRTRDFELSEAGGGTDPSPGGRGARGAGAGDPGSGY